ncbi:hypothetical protein AALC75_09690 [Lachnospiraceae bacterium 48-42]
MEHKPPKPMTPFDNMVTPPFLYTLKLMLPYTPPSTQRMLGIYIKFLELRYTLSHFNGFGNADSSRLFDLLKDYMGPEEQEMMEQMEMLMNMMEMMQGQPDMPDMSDFLGGMFGDMPHAPDSGTQNDVQKGDDTDE